MLFFRKTKLCRHPAILALSLFFFSLSLTAGNFASGADKQSRTLWNALTYLKSVPEISWLEIEGSNIIIGWNGYSSNFSAINRTAAKKASRKVPGEIRIYSVNANQKGWRPKKDAPAHLCHSLGKGGRLQFTNCR